MLQNQGRCFESPVHRFAAGPYRLSGEWWRPGEDEHFQRAYWDVHASDGAVYRVHQNERDGRWYLDGYYD